MEDGRPQHPIRAEALAPVVAQFRDDGIRFDIGMVFPVFSARLDRLCDLVHGEGITGCAVMLFTWPKAGAGAAPQSRRATARTPLSVATLPKTDTALAS